MGTWSLRPGDTQGRTRGGGWREGKEIQGRKTCRGGASHSIAGGAFWVMKNAFMEGCWIFFSHHQVFLCPWDTAMSFTWPGHGSSPIHAAKAPAHPSTGPVTLFIFHPPSDKPVVWGEKGVTSC